MDTELTQQGERYEKILSQTSKLDDILLQIAESIGIASHQFTKQEIEEARGNLSPMNDRVAMVTFADNKNNHIITGIVNALRKNPHRPANITNHANMATRTISARCPGARHGCRYD